MARAKSKDDRFQPSAETTRIVPMADGWFNGHTPGWFSRCAADLGLDDVLAEVADITKENDQ